MLHARFNLKSSTSDKEPKNNVVIRSLRMNWEIFRSAIRIYGVGNSKIKYTFERRTNTSTNLSQKPANSLSPESCLMLFYHRGRFYADKSIKYTQETWDPNEKNSPSQVYFTKISLTSLYSYEQITRNSYIFIDSGALKNNKLKTP